jgi:pimeloyl-ACP methyl ester carboxylesterase
MKRVTLMVLRIVVAIVAGIAATAFVLGLLYKPDTAAPDGYRGSVVDIGGVPLRVLQEGSGPDILMIHGSPGILEDFDLQAESLRAGFRVTRYDRPGQGFSGDDGRYSIDHNATVALAVIEKLGLQHVVVVGHSYGGATALAVALRKSPRVGAVVTLDSSVYQSVRAVNPMFRVLRLGTFGIGLARMLPTGTRESRVSEGIVGEFRAGPAPQTFIDARTHVYSTPKVVHAIANEHWGYSAELAGLSPHYGEITVPLFVVAQGDDPGRKENAERLAREVGGAEVRLLSPSGHYVQIEQPAAVTEIIRRAAAAAAQ